MNPGSKAPSRPPGFTLVELLVVIAIIAVLAGLLLPSISGIRGRSIQSKCLSNLRQIGMGMNLYANDHDGLYPYMFNDDQAPANERWLTWIARLQPYLVKSTNAGRDDAANVLSCPAKPQSAKSGANGVATFGMNSYCLVSMYGWNPGSPWGYSRVRVPKPSQIILVGDMQATNTDALASSDKKNIFGTQGYSMGFRHGAKSSLTAEGSELANVVFCDGHAESLNYDQLMLNPPDLANNPAGERSRWKWW